MKKLSFAGFFLLGFMLLVVGCPKEPEPEPIAKIKVSLNDKEIVPDANAYTFNDVYVTPDEYGEITIMIENIGTTDLSLTGKPIVRLDGATELFSITNQPAKTSLAPQEGINFTLKFKPKDSSLRNVIVIIPNSSTNEPEFSFKVYGQGKDPVPKIQVQEEGSTTNIAQNDTINTGNVTLGLSKPINITVKNIGNTVLTLDTGLITITGVEANAFSIGTRPSQNISAGGESLFTLQCTPIKGGENNGIISIPTNDPSRNPAVFYIKVTGTGVYPPNDVSTTGLSAESIRVSWTPVNGATGYNVYRSTTAEGGYTKLTTNGISSTSYTNTGLTAASTWYYCVSAYNETGEGIYSTAVSGTTYQVSTISINNPVSGDVTVPQTLTIPKGEGRTLQVSGTTGTYQWYLDGNLIPGATSAGYTVESAKMEVGVHEVMVVVTTTAGKRSGSCRVRITN
jgi:hypothetical protein